MSLKKRNICVPVLVAVICCGLIGLIFDYYYCFNDDTTLAAIFSGAYAPGPSAMATYVQYPLGLILSGLYRLAPLPWYPLYIQLCVFGSLALMLNTLLKLTDRTVVRVVMVISTMAVVFSILLFDFVFSQYTIVAGFMAITSVFIFTMDSNIFFCVLLYLNAFCLRKEIALLLLPFYAVGIVIILTGSSKEQLKQLWRPKGITLLIIFLGILACFGINRLAYSSSEWTDYLAYNDARTEMYDYVGVPDYEMYSRVYDGLGLGQSDYDVLQSYDLALADHIGTSALTTLSNSAGYNKSIASMLTDDRGEVLAAYRYQLRYCDQPLSFLALALYGVLVILLLMRGRVVQMLQPIVLFVGRSILWCYLLYMGRYPARIIHPLYFMELALLLAMLICTFRLEASKYIKGLERALTLVILVIIICLIPSSSKAVSTETDTRVKNNLPAKALAEYTEARESDVFFLDVYSSIHYTDKLFEGPSVNRVSNQILLGGWMLRSPLYADKMKYLGYGELSVAEALLEDNAFLVIQASSDTQWMQDYYYNSLGIPVVTEVLDTIGEGTDEPLNIIRIKKAD